MMPNERTAESLTPRTDAALERFTVRLPLHSFSTVDSEYVAHAGVEFARALERELAEARARLDAELARNKRAATQIEHFETYAEGLRAALESAWKSLSYIQHTYRTAQTHISWDTVFEAIPIVEAALSRSEGRD